MLDRHGAFRSGARRRRGALLGAAVVAVLALGTAACGPDDSRDGAESTPSATSRTSAATTPTTTAPTISSAPASGGILTAAQFDTLVLPKPAKMPQDGAWADATSEPHIRQATYDAGGKSYLTVYMFDCRDPQYAHATEGYGVFCHTKADTSVAGHPVWNPPGNDGTIRVVRAHNVYAYVETGVDGLATYDGPDLMAYIKSMDLSAMDRLG